MYMYLYENYTVCVYISSVGHRLSVCGQRSCGNDWPGWRDQSVGCSPNEEEVHHSHQQEVSPGRIASHAA